jgi:hypothetical protein
MMGTNHQGVYAQQAPNQVSPQNQYAQQQDMARQQPCLREIN